MTASGPRRSPLHDLLARDNPRWVRVHGMQTAVELEHESAAAPILLADASCLPRMGVKGPKAEDWLRSQGVSVPAATNTWTRTPEGAIVARLGRSEFFIEDRAGGAAVEGWRAALEPVPGIYPVLRQDAALALGGERLNDVLVQTCSVDFDAYAAAGPAVVMTALAGVPVLALQDEIGGRRWLRIWCDGTFGPYLWETLLSIAREEGGAAVGFGRLSPQVAAG